MPRMDDPKSAPTKGGAPMPPNAAPSQAGDLPATAERARAGACCRALLASVALGDLWDGNGGAPGRAAAVATGTLRYRERMVLLLARDLWAAATRAPARAGFSSSVVDVMLIRALLLGPAAGKQWRGVAENHVKACALTVLMDAKFGTLDSCPPEDRPLDEDWNDLWAFAGGPQPEHGEVTSAPGDPSRNEREPAF